LKYSLYIFVLLFLFSIISLACFSQTETKKTLFSGLSLDTLLSEKIFRLAKLAGVDSSGLLSSFRQVPIQKPAIPAVPKLPKGGGLPKNVDSVLKSAKLLEIRGGFVSYQWNYRSNIDTPFLEKDLSQHFLSAGLDMTVAGKIPVRVTLFHRNSNSLMFRDYTDFRVDYDVQTFRNWNSRKLSDIKKDLIRQMSDSIPALDELVGRYKLSSFDNLLALPDFRTAYIKAKEICVIPELAELDTSRSEELKAWASEYVQLYDSLTGMKAELLSRVDSLKKEIDKQKGQVAKVKNALDKNDFSTPDGQVAIAWLRSKGYSEKQIRQFSDPMSGIRSLSLGRSFVNISPLTVSNISMRGIQSTYMKDRFYTAVALGTIDFRVRDFVYAGTRRVPQYVAASRFGVGEPSGKHVYVTVFGGKKQLYPSASQTVAYPLYGASIEFQYQYKRNHFFVAELAQSVGAAFPIYTGTGKNKEALDKNSRGYRLQWRSFFKETRTTVSASYMHQGINFQSFTNFRTNAEVDRWNFSLEQRLFRNALTVLATAQKNDFTNPFVLQRYDANTIYKTIGVNFRKQKWPSFHLSYAPGSQLTMVDSIVYENRFQTLNINSAYQYNIGTAKSTSVVSFSRFFNGQADSSLLYYNSGNLYYTQDLSFSALKLNWGISYMESGPLYYSTMEAGAQYPILPHTTLHSGIKINKLGIEKPKIGFYVHTQIQFPRVGDLNVWLEKNYLPGMNRTLIENAFYHIGFTRFFTVNTQRK
jgi:hypothetical protein